MHLKTEALDGQELAMIRLALHERARRLDAEGVDAGPGYRKLAEKFRHDEAAVIFDPVKSGE